MLKLWLKSHLDPFMISSTESNKKLLKALQMECLQTADKVKVSGHFL